MLTIVSVILLLVTICSLPAKGIRNITVSDKKEIRFTFNDRPIVIDISLRSLVSMVDAGHRRCRLLLGTGSAGRG